jgi:predicted RNA binding protein YcfA (HicA-like mRNA interferase family)
MEQFPSMKARQLLRILQRGPLNYVAVDQRRRGSHRLLRATGRKDVVFSFHDRITVPLRFVRSLLVTDIGLSEGEAIQLLGRNV